MGSGDRFQFHQINRFGLGFSLATFPFILTIDIHILFWYISVGFGKGYDEA